LPSVLAYAKIKHKKETQVSLIIILLTAVSILTLLSGIAVLSGARKGERTQAFLFFFTTLFSLGWAVLIATFLGLPETTAGSTAKLIFTGYYFCAPIMCWGLMSYACYKYKLGKIAMVFFGLCCATLIGLICYNPSLLYDSFTLSRDGNSVQLHQGIFYLVYGAYHCVTVLLYMIGLFHTAHHARNARIKKANLMVLYGFTFTGIIALIFNFVLPYFGKYDTIWVGPLAMCVAWVLHYYAILKYRLLDLSGRWLRTLSHIIIMSLAAIIFLAIFFIIFIALFKVPSPSSSVIILNIIMVTTVILLFPALNEVSAYVRSLASVNDIDMVYLVKKLELISKSYINYHELADFLAEHLHFQYIGLIIDGHLYGSKLTKISTTEIAKITKMKPADKGIWLTLTDDVKETLKSTNVEAVAELRSANGEVVGKIILGRTLGNINFKSRNQNAIETALTLTAAAINSEKGPRN